MKNFFFAKKHNKRKQQYMKECFRELQTNLSYQLGNSKKNIIVVSSANKSEGKSYCSLQIALAFGESGKRVLLVDLDLYRSRLSNDLANNFAGITSIYFEGQKSDECIVELNKNVSFLPSGLKTINPTEIINSSCVEKVIYAAAENFDVVLIDAPPIRGVADTKNIVKKFNNILFVVRANKTKTHEVEEAFEKIKIVNPNIMGMVLNMKKMSNREIQTYVYE
ncbi:capsular biosynthesis protein [Bacillus cereus]|nr:capsular biosynthesis protein [Bacillus cereus]